MCPASSTAILVISLFGNGNDKGNGNDVVAPSNLRFIIDVVVRLNQNGLDTTPEDEGS